MKGKRRKFCHYYVGKADFNAAKAYRLAGYSKKGARQSAAKLLTNTDIEAYIDELQADSAKAAGVSKLDLILKLKHIALGCTADFMEDWENLKSFKSLPKKVKDNIKKISIKKTKIPDMMAVIENITVEAKDDLRAIEILAKMLGYNEAEKKQIDVNDVSGFMPDGFED